MCESRESRDNALIGSAEFLRGAGQLVLQSDLGGVQVVQGWGRGGGGGGGGVGEGEACEPHTQNHKTNK